MDKKWRELIKTIKDSYHSDEQMEIAAEIYKNYKSRMSEYYQREIGRSLANNYDAKTKKLLDEWLIKKVSSLENKSLEETSMFINRLEADIKLSLEKISRRNLKVSFKAGKINVKRSVFNINDLDLSEDQLRYEQCRIQNDPDLLWASYDFDEAFMRDQTILKDQKAHELARNVPVLDAVKDISSSKSCEENIKGHK